MIEKANFVAKPVLVSQQIMPSMLRNLRPTRSEASDINAAVLSGADCLCLDEETAIGDYPANSVTMLCKCLVEAEYTVDFKKDFNDIKLFCPPPEGCAESVALSSVQTTVDLQVSLIAVYTTNGKLARQVARYRPEKPVIVVSSIYNIIR